MEAWSGISLGFVAAAGNVTQLYPTWCAAGVDPAAATNGQQIRQPTAGVLYSLQVETDGTNGGIIEIWDVSGADAGADVSSATTITDAQLDALAARGLAKLIYSQNFAASGLTPPTAGPRTIMRGLAARFVGSAGVCKLNLVVNGGFRFTTKVG
jgi:hypothetical protein